MNYWKLYLSFCFFQIFFFWNPLKYKLLKIMKNKINYWKLYLRGFQKKEHQKIKNPLLSNLLKIMKNKINYSKIMLKGFLNFFLFIFKTCMLGIFLYFSKNLFLIANIMEVRSLFRKLCIVNFRPPRIFSGIFQYFSWKGWSISCRFRYSTFSYDFFSSLYGFLKKQCSL